MSVAFGQGICAWVQDRLAVLSYMPTNPGIGDNKVYTNCIIVLGFGKKGTRCALAINKVPGKPPKLTTGSENATRLDGKPTKPVIDRRNAVRPQPRLASSNMAAAIFKK